MLTENIGREARSCFGIDIKHCRGTGRPQFFRFILELRQARSQSIDPRPPAPVNMELIDDRNFHEWSLVFDVFIKEPEYQRQSTTIAV